MVKIAIITAVRNGEATIGDLIDSLAAQDFKNFEHIIIEGKSEDKTLEIIEQKRKPYTRVIAEKETGIYNALNQGILASTGDVIGFLHADDLYANNQVLSKVAEAFEDKNLDACYGDHEYISSKNKRRVIRYWRAGLYRQGIFLRGWMPPHPSFFARRQLYERFGLFNTSFKISADYELMIRFIHKHQISLAYIPEVIVKMRMGGISNKSLRNVCLKTLEDIKAWKLNHLIGGKRAVFLKNVSKIPQFFIRQHSSVLMPKIPAGKHTMRKQKRFEPCVLTIDVEDWFHILQSDALPSFEMWSSLESRVENNLSRLLDLLESNSLKATFFWLGWLAERHKDLVRKCQEWGHEIASHGYAHILACEAGHGAYRQDITRAKSILEDIIGEPVRGFRAPGFGVTEKAPWAFDVIKESGYEYDSSVFPAYRAHGGISDSPLGPYFIETKSGHLLEIPMSTVEIFGNRISLFGGGYLRLANKLMINWGIQRLSATKRPLILYVHPREIDPDQPRLQLNLLRSFKYYINLNTTYPKLEWLCKKYSFCTMLEMVENYVKSFYFESKTIPVLRLRGDDTSNELSIPIRELIDSVDHEVLRRRVIMIEKAMASFLSPNVMSSDKT